MKKQNNVDKSTNDRAITLITLVITIVILIILAGITINLALGDNGIFSTAKQAKEQYLNAQTTEEDELNDLYSEILVATGDDSKITISVEELGKLIDEKVEEKTNSLQTELLEQTTVYAGSKYKLKDSIKNYNKIEIYAGVITTSDKTGIVWNSVSMITKNIVYYNDSNKEKTYIPVYIASSTSHYRVPHFAFTEEDEIYFCALNSAGWTTAPSDCYKLIVYGYK
jgi:type II secretory pathway pseudopilin PulG